LPGGLANDSINENAFFSADLVSVQGLNTAFAGGPLAGLGAYLGLSDLTQQAPHLMNPSAPFTINTDFTPTWRAHDDFMAVNWKQKIVPWLDFEANFGYDHGSTVSQESYNNGAAASINPPFNSGGSLSNFCQVAPVVGLPCNNGLGTFQPAALGYAVENTLYDILAGPPFGPAYAAQFAPYFSHNGLLPVSNFNGLGISTSPNNVQYYTNTFSTFDQSNAQQEQFSLDARFTSSFKGPINFMVGAFYLRQEAFGDYYVSSGAQGYASVMLGALGGEAVPFCAPTPGCTLASVFYDNRSPPGGVTLKSKSAYGEVYWDIMPDLLKLTIGGRWTDDYKSQEDRITLINGVVPIGDANINDPQLAYCGAPAVSPPNPCTTGAALQEYQFQNQNFVKITGRAVLDYTPQLDFTDQTLIYASLSRGYKAGGFNPGITAYAAAQGVSSAYNPEGIDAIELGTKNMLMHDTLQANGDIWYYNYEGLQISQILDNDSINANINSHMYGAEGNFVYAPDEHWAFNLNTGYTHSAIGNSYLVDPRNPTAGLANAVLIKDVTPTGTAAQNCAVYLTTATLAPGSNPALTSAFAAAYVAHPLDPNLAANPYFAPPGGSGALASAGIPLTNYGTCNPSFFLDPNVVTVMNANGYAFQTGPNATAAGVAVNLHGNQNPNSPDFTISFGAQYTFGLGGDYTLVPRFDIYYQTSMYGRAFEDGADKISSFEVMNAQVQLNSPNSMWYVQAYIKNLAGKTYVTGEYLTSSSSGLYTNEFLGDPRFYGVRAGINF